MNYKQQKERIIFGSYIAVFSIVHIWITVSYDIKYAIVSGVLGVGIFLYFYIKYVTKENKDEV